MLGVKRLAAFAGLALTGVAFVRRKLAGSRADEVLSPAGADMPTDTSSSPAPPAEPAGDPQPEVPDFAYEPDAVPDQSAREVESQATDETRFERLAETELEARHEAAERLKDDPLTERLDEPPPEDR